ncbi:MAG: hypothetical protein U5K54_28300 [Cytophagales bacterium]|nr:hypothetical protein [Cytophagales bacterium]
MDEVRAVDFALLDATFYTASELPNRDIKEVPHPYVEEPSGYLMESQNYKRKSISYISIIPIHCFGVKPQEVLFGPKVFRLLKKVWC